MSRYTIRYKGTIMGTYSGANEKEALDVLAKEQGCANHAALLVKRKLNPEDIDTKTILEDDSA